MLRSDHILVTGPQSSGTRLLCDILVDGGLEPYHDKSHGIKFLMATKVVVITRDPIATKESQDSLFLPNDQIDRTQSIMGALRYTNAMWVIYEELCFNPDFVIATLASWLNIDPWPLTFEVINQNIDHNHLINKNIW